MSGLYQVLPSWPRSDSNEGRHHISQNPSITRASPLDFLMSCSGHTLVEVLFIYRDAVGVCYCPSRMDYSTLIGGDLTPLQRCSWCILQPQPNGPQGTLWWGSYPSVEMQSMYSTAPADCAVFVHKKLALVV